MVCYASKPIGIWYSCLTHLTIEIIREFVMSLQMIIYAKQNGAQMAAFAATGTRADIDDLRKTMAALGMRLLNKDYFVSFTHDKNY